MVHNNASPINKTPANSYVINSDRTSNQVVSGSYTVMNYALLDLISGQDWLQLVKDSMRTQWNFVINYAGAYDYVSGAHMFDADVQSFWSKAQQEDYENTALCPLWWLDNMADGATAVTSELPEDLTDSEKNLLKAALRIAQGMGLAGKEEIIERLQKKFAKGGVVSESEKIKGGEVFSDDGLKDLVRLAIKMPGNYSNPVTLLTSGIRFFASAPDEAQARIIHFSDLKNKQVFSMSVINKGGIIGCRVGVVVKEDRFGGQQFLDWFGTDLPIGGRDGAPFDDFMLTFGTEPKIQPSIDEFQLDLVYGSEPIVQLANKTNCTKVYRTIATPLAKPMCQIGFTNASRGKSKNYDDGSGRYAELGGVIGMKAFADALRANPELAAVHFPYALRRGSVAENFMPLTNTDGLHYDEKGDVQYLKFVSIKAFPNVKGYKPAFDAYMTQNNLLDAIALWALYQSTMVAVGSYINQKFEEGTPWTQPIQGVKFFKRGTTLMTEPLQDPKTAIKTK